jgi:predicted aspartyl protease
MSVRDLKAELSQLKQPTNDVFEKEQLVQRLFQARVSQKTMVDTTPTTRPSNTIQIPLLFTNMDNNIKIAAQNFMDGGIIAEAGDQPFATIQLTVEGKHGDFQLNLLLDTACTGFVLRPEIVSKYNLPSFTTPVTMTGAGGQAGSTGLTQLDTFRLGDQSFGPLPAAVQNIGALPKGLDGILGLSFLSRFECVEMDFSKGKVTFFHEKPTPKPDNLQVVAKGEMKLIPRLGIYSVNVYIGDRGPVEMIFDTGASASLLSWKGIADLGLSKHSNFVQPLTTRMGAMGSDNTAIQLSHRINISSKVDIGKPGSYPGISLGAGSKRLSMDVGDIPLLKSLENQGVGGILGIDALARCAVLRFKFRGNNRIITMLQDSPLTSDDSQDSKQS